MFTTLRHHWDVFRAALEAEKQYAAGRRGMASARRDELAFLPAALEIADTPVPPLARWLAGTVAALVLASVGWSVVARVDIRAGRANSDRAISGFPA